MNINRLTQKAQEAVIAAQTLAQRNGQPEIGTLHLLQAPVDQPQGVVPHLLGRMGVDARALAGATTIELERLSKVATSCRPVPLDPWRASHRRLRSRRGDGPALGQGIGDGFHIALCAALV